MKSPLGRFGFNLLLLVARVRDKLGTWLTSGALGSCGGSTTIVFPCRIIGPEGIHLGSSVYIGQSSWLCTQKGVPGAAPEPVLRIGNAVRMSGHCVLSAAQEVVLEDGVLLARNVYISDHSHAFSTPDRPIHEQGLDKVAPVRIEANAWLGQNVVVGPGVTIGRGAVIGTGSFVNKNIPAYAIAVGSPAEVLRMIHGDDERQAAIKSVS